MEHPSSIGQASTHGALNAHDHSISRSLPDGPLLQRDWVGSEVRLRRDLGTRSGNVLPARLIMKVVSVSRGVMTLRSSVGTIRWVAFSDVDYVGPAIN